MKKSCNYIAFRYFIIKLTADYKMAHGIRISNKATQEGGYSLVFVSLFLFALDKSHLCLEVQQWVISAYFSEQKRGK